MKGRNYTYLILIVFLLSACAANIQTYDIDQEYATSLHYDPPAPGDEPQEVGENENLVGVPALSFYNGDLKRGAIWWAGKGIILEKGDVFLINAFNVGPDNTPFGATFPPIDLVKEPVMIKVTARVEATFGDSLMLYMQVDDASGYQANAKRPFCKINNSTEFTDYYFDMRDIYIQNEPKKHAVNGAMINSLKFFINPGMSGFTGKLFIKEIRVVSVKSLESK